MSRIPLVALLVVSAVLLAPASALAGTYSWSLPGDFTTASGGSNPEHGYGQPSWTYEADGSRMSNFGGSSWSDASGDSISVSGGSVTMQAMVGHTVTIAWANPFATSQSVTISSTFSGNSLCILPGGVSQPNGTTTLSPGETVSVTLNGTTCSSASGTISIVANTPTVTLTSPANGATYGSGEPVFSGRASTAFDASNNVTVRIYKGASPSGTPVQTLNANIGGGGSYSATPGPLTNGQYTAQAEQDDPAGQANFSAPVTFTLQNAGPLLTLDRPPANSWVGRADLRFSGHAGDAAGDSRIVNVYLYRGRHASGRPLGKVGAHAHGSSWSTRWPQRLRVGLYTVSALQSNKAGHTTRTSPRTFRLVSVTQAVGSKLTVNGSGLASVPVGCLAPSSQTCKGTVLVVTKRSFRTTPGGPSGPLEVLFANVRIDGATMSVVRGGVSGLVLKVMRRLKQLEVRVTITLSKGGNSSVTRRLRVT